MIGRFSRSLKVGSRMLTPGFLEAGPEDIPDKMKISMRDVGRQGFV
jgi:hypothetical protein